MGGNGDILYIAAKIFWEGISQGSPLLYETLYMLKLPSSHTWLGVDRGLHSTVSGTGGTQQP